MDIIVSKYGGSSITCKEDIERIKKITEDDVRRKVIVVSAPGKRHEKGYENDTKVTDMLIELARTKDATLANKIIDRYKSLWPENCTSLTDDLCKRMNGDIHDAAYMDALKAFGEEACAKVVAGALGACYIDPKDIFMTTNDFGNARILPESEERTKERIRQCVGNGVVVIPGFYGYTRDGFIATLSRGGSDVTGAYIAASLDALVYENFTDREGILAADPALVDNPAKIEKITYKEIRDLAYSGFTIFHEDAMNHVERKFIPVHVRKTASYPHKGTYIVHDRVSDVKRPLIGVAYQHGFCSFTIERFGLNGANLFTAIFDTFQQESVAVEFVNNAIDDITIIVREENCKKTHAISNVVKKLYAAIGTDSSIKFQEHLGCLVVAGKGLKGRRGISADIQSTLADTDVNICFISQGSQERSIIYGIASEDGKKAVNAVYDKYLR